jgi:hypothetical protein
MISLVHAYTVLCLDTIRSYDLKNVLNTPVYTFQCEAHVVYHSTWKKSLCSHFAHSRYWKTRARLRLLQSVCLHGVVYFKLHM